MEFLATIEARLEAIPQTADEIVDYLRTMACVHPERGTRRMPTSLDDMVFDKAADEIVKLRAALSRIHRWHEEFPATGKCWKNADGTQSNRPMSYEAAYGSNGARDYMRGVAAAALGAAT